MAATDHNVYTNLIYTAHDPLHLSVKPYRLQYEAKELPRTNCQVDRRSSILINDMRGKEETFAVERNGFEILKLDSEMALEDFNNRSKIESVYYEELRQLLKQHFAARRVEILEHENRYGSVILNSRFQQVRITKRCSRPRSFMLISHLLHRWLSVVGYSK